MRKNKDSNANGWIFIDKPIGVSSNKLLQKVRKLFLFPKAGYVGTLDPMAMGFLPIAIGKATKTIKYLEKEDKEYTFTVQWGEKTNTGDIEGKIIGKTSFFPNEKSVIKAVKKFKGKILQTPSKYSALKINGKRAYKMVREGENFKMPTREVEIFDFKIIQTLNKYKTIFYIKCSSGMYIRTLAEDLAHSLGTYAHILTLRRVGFGKLDKKLISLDSLISLMHIDKLINNLKPIDVIFEKVKRIDLKKNEAKDLLDGKSLFNFEVNQKEKKKINCNHLTVAKYKKELFVVGNFKDNCFYPETILNMNLKD